jgi:uncharacterized protein
MTGITNLSTLLRKMTPTLHEGEYVFCSVADPGIVPVAALIMQFKEAEGYTLILPRTIADTYQLQYNYIAAWITLEIHSALEAVGLTAAFAQALATNGISCNVVAGYYHDHIFVAHSDAHKAMQALQHLSAPTP